MNILEELAESNKKIIKEKRKLKPLSQIRNEAENIISSHPSFKRALEKSEISFICELKKASPSKGLICPDFDYLKFARDYQENGVSAISCLTEPTQFLGNLEILNDVIKHSKLPVLRKDFLTEEYQIYESKLANASALLLIVALLDINQLKDLLFLTKEMGMDALVEVHSEEEIEKALQAEAQIIGINNRDLRNFHVDLNTSAKLAKYLPDEIVRISESGIHSAKDIQFLKNLGFNGVLIGEQLMSHDNIPNNLKNLMNYED